jgi:hypothetical protein
MIQQVGEFERRFVVHPAYDRRAKGNGIHGVDMSWALIGAEGAIAFTVSTNWQLSLVGRPSYRDDKIDPPMAVDISYHSRKPIREWHTQPSTESCCWLDGAPCYCDGSTLNADPILDAFISKGEDGVWAELEDWYRDKFGGVANA